LICFPNAKINIGLFITSKRPDGYHNLETIFYPIPRVKDALEITPSTKDTTNLILNGESISGDIQDNLVWKAWKTIEKNFPKHIHPIDIHLLKAIPMGAGLGGGSADAAFFIQLANDYFNLKMTQQEMANHALTLGSDCPFFIYNTPQVATGRGEIFQLIDLNLSNYTIQIVYPSVHISTQLAFSKVNPMAAAISLDKLQTFPIEHWKDHIYNDFEQSIFPEFPELKAIKQHFYDEGAIYASLSGSGSALYGIFPKNKKANFSAFKNVQEL
jgi:4-diphosphocytidyl-2-C-methyl-D-erythritol kinase